MLFTHAIEGTYSVPEYGGNHALVGWRDIGFPGDSQPTGYSDAEVSERDDPGPAGSPVGLITPEAFAAVLPWLARAGRRGR